MELYRKVRLACRDGMSERAAARHFGVSRQSVRKMLQFSVPPGYRRTAPVRRPKLDEFTGLIEQWLEDDRRHGYARKTPRGTQIARWYCPESHTTFSLLPDCLAARLPGELDTLEAVVAHAERAPSRSAAANALRREAQRRAALLAELGEELVVAGVDAQRDLHVYFAEDLRGGELGRQIPVATAGTDRHGDRGEHGQQHEDAESPECAGESNHGLCSTRTRGQSTVNRVLQDHMAPDHALLQRTGH